MTNQDLAIVPTESELNLACAVIVRKTIRLFFNVPDSEEPRGGEVRLLEAWRQIEPERREAALLEHERQIWQGLLDRLQATPLQRALKKEAIWHD